MYYLLGGSGVPNYGDELMAGGWLRYLAKTKPDARVVIDTNVSSVSTLLLQPENWKASHVSIAKKIAQDKPLTYFWQNFERGYKFFARGGFERHPRFLAFDRYLREAEVLHMFGGGYMSKKWPQTGFLLGFAGAAQAEYSLKLVATGLGMTPIDRPQASLTKTVRRVIERFDIFELRDSSSFSSVTKDCGGKNAIFGLDDSFIEPVNPPTDADPVLHVSCFMKDQNLERFIISLTKRKAEIENKFSAIKFWMCAPHRDMTAFSKFKESFPTVELVSLEDLINKHTFGKDDVMITTRFHPHMIAARSGIRGYFYAIPGEYYSDKHDSVLTLGSKFRPFFELDERGFELETSSEMANADPIRVRQKLELAKQIYG